MIEQQQKLCLSPYMAIYDLVIPKDNLLRKINDLIDFSFVYDELINKYCLDNGRNAINPIRMFKYLLLKAILTYLTLTLLNAQNMICRLNISLKWHRKMP